MDKVIKWIETPKSCTGCRHWSKDKYKCEKDVCIYKSKYGIR